MTFAEMQAQGKIEVAAEQTLIEGYIEAATELIEYGTQKKFVERQFRLHFDAAEITGKEIICLEQFDSGLVIDAFTLFDDTEPTAVETAVPADDFLLLDNRVQLRGDFPDVTLRKFKAAKIEYTVQSAPRTETLTETIGLLVGHWWKNRETVVISNKTLQNIPAGIITLIQSMRVPSA